MLLKWIIYIVFLVHREEIELRILDYLSDEGLITVFENNAENNIELIEDFVKNLSLKFRFQLNEYLGIMDSLSDNKLLIIKEHSCFLLC